MIKDDFAKYENDKRDEYIRLDTTIIGIDNLIAKASTAEEANALFKAKDVIYSQQRYLTYRQSEPPLLVDDDSLPNEDMKSQNNMTADERYCRECMHNEVCRYCPRDGCDFKETPKEAEPVKHAQWIRKHNSFPQRYFCTNCGEGAVGRFTFCPNCGYKMGV